MFILYTKMYICDGKKIRHQLWSQKLENKINLHCCIFKFHFQSLCGTKCKVKKKAKRNSKNYCSNGFLREQLLHGKAQTRGIALSLFKGL